VFEDTPGVTRSAPPGGSVVLAGDEGGGAPSMASGLQVGAAQPHAQTR